MFRAAAAVSGPAGEIRRGGLFLSALWISCLLFHLQTEANLLSLRKPFFSSPAFFLLLAASSRDFFRTGDAFFRQGRHDGSATRNMIFFHPPRGVMELERAVFIREHREYKIEVPEKQLHWQWARAILHEMIFGVTCCAEVSGTNTGRGFRSAVKGFGLRQENRQVGVLCRYAFPVLGQRPVPVPAFLRVASRGEGRRKRGMIFRTTRNSGGSEHRKGSWIHGTTF